jgi:hypothetical protein
MLDDRRVAAGRREGIDEFEDLEDVVADVLRTDLVAETPAVQELDAGEPVLGGLGQRRIDRGHVDELGAARMAAGQNLGHQHGENFRLLLERRVRVPVAASTRDADRLAVTFDVGETNQPNSGW